MKKRYFLFGEGSKINQILMAVLINLPVFSYGACIGWMSPMTLLLQSKDTPRSQPLTDFEVSWMAATAYLTCVPLDYLMAYLGDRVGRKATLIFMSISCGVLWAIKLTSLETWALILARALVGVSMAGCYVTCPTYTKEISEDSIRGSLGTLVILFHTVGNLFLYVIGDLLSYRSVLWICLTMPVLHIVLFVMMPESPSYLIKKGKEEEAARVVAWLRCRSEQDSLVISELEAMKKEQQNDSESDNFVYKAISAVICDIYGIWAQYVRLGFLVFGSEPSSYSTRLAACHDTLPLHILRFCRSIACFSCAHWRNFFL